MATQNRDFGKRTDMYRVDPLTIRIAKNHNPRDYKLAENRANLDEVLKPSIREIGVQKPLTVRRDGEQLILVDGESRLTAVLELIKEGVQIDSVPCILLKENDPAMLLMHALMSNTGKPLSAWEAGTAYKKLQNYGWDDEKIASTVGVPLGAMRKAIELSEAAPDVKQMLSERAITPQLAIQITRKHGSGAGDVARAAVAAKKATGKKGPAKADKKKAENPWEKIGRLIYKSVVDELNEMDKEGAEKYEYTNLPTQLAKKLGKLVNGEKG